MDFCEVVERRRTIRDFADSAVAPAVMLRVFEAGLRAPSYNHLREWDFMVVKDDDRWGGATEHGRQSGTDVACPIAVHHFGARQP